MNKSIDISGLNARPLPAEMTEIVMCTNCQEAAARWEFAEGPVAAAVFACSACVLYKVPQLKKQRHQVEFIIGEVEKKLGTVFLRDEEGRLVVPADADRIVGGIVAADRVLRSRVMRGGFGSNEDRVTRH